jgi:hypothetical protein
MSRILAVAREGHLRYQHSSATKPAPAVGERADDVRVPFAVPPEQHPRKSESNDAHLKLPQPAHAALVSAAVDLQAWAWSVRGFRGFGRAFSGFIVLEIRGLEQGLGHSERKRAKREYFDTTTVCSCNDE